ncbi:MAG TPA: hypothetical protein VFB45_21515 [Pseudolabrys sp.]|nr:hypothetical protein [Pseudolabrys sp.]
MKRVVLALAAVSALAFAAPSFANDHLAQANTDVKAGANAGAAGIKANAGANTSTSAGTSSGASTSANVSGGAKIGKKKSARVSTKMKSKSRLAMHDRGLHRGFSHSRHLGYAMAPKPKHHKTMIKHKTNASGTVGAGGSTSGSTNVGTGGSIK